MLQKKSEKLKIPKFESWDKYGKDNEKYLKKPLKIDISKK